MRQIVADLIIIIPDDYEHAKRLEREAVRELMAVMNTTDEREVKMRAAEARYCQACLCGDCDYDPR